MEYYVLYGPEIVDMKRDEENELDEEKSIVDLIAV